MGGEGEARKFVRCGGEALRRIRREGEAGLGVRRGHKGLRHAPPPVPLTPITFRWVISYMSSPAQSPRRDWDAQTH